MKNQKIDVTKSPYFLMPILLLMWGSLAAISKLLLNNLDSYQVLFYMYGIGVAAFFIIVVFKGKFSAILSWKRSEFAFLCLCGTLSFLYDFFYLKSLERIPAVEASMLNYLFPIFIVIFAIPIHKEKLTVSKSLSIVMGFMGTLLLVTKGDLANVTFTNFTGDLFAILAAVSWGLFTNLIKKNKKDMFLSTFFITFTAFVLSVGSMLLSSEFLIPQRTDFFGVSWLSISNIVLGFFLYFRALKYSPASLIASFTFFTPFVTLVFIVILLGEKLTISDYFAALLIIFSVPIQKVGTLVGKKKSQLINKGNNI
ncbi:DMT family transporter [Neobacillus cucumis]|uniref:DMT family transporter n=1 Tax=Neobacillus cucumis TaxID=1740721 RepID=UPI0019635C0A|nr:DMT family transporter [Neobacillus cucumis]MBM7653483.1 drug/metabolite transporter (DMT)-like permease [Neobacillus cucumis]